jgi:hypothetical protein
MSVEEFTYSPLLQRDAQMYNHLIFNVLVFTYFWYKNLAAKPTHSSVKLNTSCHIWTKADSSWSSMLECVHLAAKISCKKYLNTWKVVIQLGVNAVTMLIGQPLNCCVYIHVVLIASGKYIIIREVSRRGIDPLHKCTRLIYFLHSLLLSLEDKHLILFSNPVLAFLCTIWSKFTITVDFFWSISTDVLPSFRASDISLLCSAVYFVHLFLPDWNSHSAWSAGWLTQPLLLEASGSFLIFFLGDVGGSATATL